MVRLSLLLLGAGILPASFACSPAGPAARIVDLAEIKAALAPQGQPVVVNHWATWCPPCLEEMPHLARLAQKYAGKVRFLGVSWDLMVSHGGEEDVLEKVLQQGREKSIPFDSLVVRADPEKLGEFLGLEALHIPQTYVFDREGKRTAFFEFLPGEEEFLQLDRAIAAVAD